MRFMFTQTLLALCACAPLPVLTPAQQAAGPAVRAAWAQKALPEPVGWRTFRCDLSRYYVEVLDGEDFTSTCGALPTKAAGCLEWTSSNHFFRPFQWPRIIVGPKYAADQGLVVHELLHAYVRCARVGVSVWDQGDYQHTSPRIWKAAGGAGSVQHRAAALLEEGP